MGDKTQRIARYPSRIPLQNVAELRLYTGKETPHDYAITLGASTLNDGCGSAYYWDITYDVADDGVNTIRPTAINPGDPCIWRRVIDTCKNYVTQQEEVISDGNAVQTIPHDLGVDTFNAQITKINGGFNEDIDVTIGRSNVQVQITFNGGSQPAVGVAFDMLLTEIVLNPAVGGP